MVDIFDLALNEYVVGLKIKLHFTKIIFFVKLQKNYKKFC